MESEQDDTRKHDKEQQVTVPEKAAPKLWRRILRWILRGAAVLIGAVALITLLYVLFFLRNRLNPPQNWHRDTSPIFGFDIPDDCEVRVVSENPYDPDDYVGYRITRYEFIPDSEEITPFFADWFHPQNQKAVRNGTTPLILCAPITGGRMHLENIFSRHFADQGYAAFLVHRPVEYDKGKRRMAEIAYWWQMMTRQSRLAYRWALETQAVDRQRTATFGISNGGFRHVYFAAMEPRVRAHVICLAGGSLAEMLFESDFVAEERAQIMEENGFDRDQFLSWLKAKIEYEPLDFAPHADPSRVLLILSRFDTTVPYKYGLRLRRAFGGPDTISLPLGHYTAAFAIPYIKHAAVSFMEERFEAASHHGG